MSEKTLHLVSLGCAKNLVDSEIMLGRLLEAGYKLMEDPAAAQVLLVNTCGFIRPAVEEAVDEILRLAAFKEENTGKKLVVTGCLVQRYGEELARELPEVDLFVGVDGIGAIDRLIATERGTCSLGRPPVFLQERDMARRLSSTPGSAFVKITDGCDNRCAYCLIPTIRGSLRSRSVDDVVAEARGLCGAGVRELNLIAQDLTAFGRDRNRDGELETLLARLLAETDAAWIRLLYLYPTAVSSTLLDLMADQPRIVPYLDIPFQHVSDRILRRMNRRYGLDDLDALVAAIRTRLPECALRTTMLVGFPGERDEDIELMLTALRRWRLDHVGVFPYQDEEECTAHGFSDKVAPETAVERYQRVMSVQAGISAQRIGRLVGRVEEVLVEGVSPETDLLLQGRLRSQAPEVDGCVYINEGEACQGEIVRVRISEAHTYDLVGAIVDGQDGPVRPG